MKILKRSTLLLLCLFLFPTKVYAADEWNYNYTGGIEIFTAPETATYEFELQGGSAGVTYNGAGYGSGGNTTGKVVLKKGDKVYIAVGGKGSVSTGATVPGGYNGGGSASGSGTGSGGGATHIATKTGLLKDLNDSDIIMVAGGGGGSSINSTGFNTGSSGGGLVGGSTEYSSPGTQTSGYLKGQGENGGNGIGGAGGGYWGGYKSASSAHASAGGSGYLSKKVKDGLTNQGGILNQAGYVKIKKVGEAKTSVYINTGTNGKINGVSEYKLDGTVGTTVTLPTPVPNQSYVSFVDFTKLYGDGVVNGMKYTFGYEDTYLQANFDGKLVDLTATQNGSKLSIKVKAQSISQNIVDLMGRLDNNSWNSLATYVTGQNSNILANPETIFNGYKDGGYDYTIPISGTYLVKLVGAGGGMDGKLADGTDRPATGGGGATLTFRAHFDANDKLNFMVGEKGEDSGGGTLIRQGGRGWRKGGNGGDSGGGGGATGADLVKSDGTKANIAVAAGGGGANWIYGEGGRITTDGNRNYWGLDGNGQDGEYNSSADNSGGGGAGGTPGDGAFGGTGGENGNSASSNEVLWWGLDWFKGGAGGGNCIRLYEGNKHGLQGLELVSEIAGIAGAGGYDGLASIKPESFDSQVSAMDGNQVITVDIPDKKAPDKPSKSYIRECKATTAVVSLETTTDYGNQFQIQIPNYTDIRTFEYISGFKGWRYAVNSQSNFKITSSNSTFTSSKTVEIGVSYNNQWIHIAAVDVAGNISDTVHIKVPDTLTINYVRNDNQGHPTGGTPSTSSTGSLKSQSLAKDSLNDSITLKNNESNNSLGDVKFTRTGYYVKYWNTKSDGSGTTFNFNQTVEYDYIKDNYGLTLDLYAIWEPIQYTVNLYKNTPNDASNNISYIGDSSWIDNQSYYSKKFVFDKDTLPVPNQIYSLKGWNLNNKWYSTKGTNGTATGTEYNSGIKNLTSSNDTTISLYPYWNKNKYTIIYNGNDTVNNVYGDKVSSNFTGNTPNTSCLYDTDVTIAINKFSKLGYKFNGWNTKSDGTGVSYTENQKITKANLVSVNNGTITLYAIWEPIKYTVNLYKNTPNDATNTIKYSGDSTWVNNQSYYSNEFRYDNANVKLQNTNIYSLKGWTIGSYWYETQDGNNGGATGSTHQANDINLTATDKAVINLYPKWTKNKYTIIYSGNNTENNIYGDKTTTTFTGNTPDTSCEYDTNVILATNGFSKTGYLFKGWNTLSDGSGTFYKSGETLVKPNFTDKNNGQFTLYAIWEPITYTVKFYGNNNWNTEQSTYTSTDLLGRPLRYDEPIKLENRFNRTAPYTDGNTTYSQSWKFRGWVLNPNSITLATSLLNTSNKCTPENTEKSLVYNFITSQGGEISLYASWERDIELKFNLNGGSYNASNADITLTATIYNNQMSYEFNIIGGTTSEKPNYFTSQLNSIDAYGTYNTNGENKLYTKKDSSHILYRFIGWSTNPSANIPDSEFDMFSSSREPRYTVYNNTTLYAVWESVLIANINLGRTLGSNTFSDGSKPIDTVSNLSADGVGKLEVIIRPGEQAFYTIRTSSKADSIILFEERITDIYTYGDSNAAWKDDLNPSTQEDFKLDQGHGLNRFISNTDYINRKFHIPQYLGTDRSYTTSNPNESSIPVNHFTAILNISKDSYYWSKVHNKKEELNVEIDIYLNNDKSKNEVSSILDDLRTKIKIRIKQ